jgi:UPF0755 protein
VSRRGKLLAVALLGGALVLFVLAAVEINYLFLPAKIVGTTSFVIEPGDNARDIADTLYGAGLIRSRLLFLIIARQKGLEARLRAGEYTLEPGLTVEQIVQRLEKGQVNPWSFTVPEGTTVMQIADILAEKGYAGRDEFLEAARDPDLVKEFLPAGSSLKEPLEGYLAPNTYKVRKGAPAEEFIKIMLDATKSYYTQEFKQRLDGVKLTFHEALTLASIVEREAALDSERPVIASVYFNRLHIGMKLDADPTVMYAIGRTTGDLALKDLEYDSPYNTYRVPGLPPGPIACPGLKSLEAVLSPSGDPYLYFVANGDRSHLFSRTLAEHMQNIKRARSSSR